MEVNEFQVHEVLISITTFTNHVINHPIYSPRSLPSLNQLLQNTLKPQCGVIQLVILNSVS
jgi:hypothetical protein